MIDQTKLNQETQKSEKSQSNEPEIRFIEYGHKYIHVDTGQELMSATKFIKQFSNPFDKDKWSNHVAERDNIPVEMVLKQWKQKSDESCALGTYIHKYAECKILNLPLPVAVTYEHKMFFKAIDTFMAAEEFSFFEPEKIIGSPKIGIAGTVDAPAKKGGNIYLIDWKTNQKIDIMGFKGEKCLAPIDFLDDCSYITYSLQLSLYRYILETIYGWEVKGQRLVHLKIDGSYQIYEPQYLKEAILMMLKHTGRLK